MTSTSVVLHRAGSTLSLAFAIGSAVAGMLGSAAAIAARITGDATPNALGRSWSAGSGSTHSEAYGLLGNSPQAAWANSNAASCDVGWGEYVFDPSASADVDALSETADAALDFVERFGPSSLQLAHLDPIKVHGEHLATLLRATSTWRDEIQGWNDALQVSAEALKLANIDPQDALFGMI